MTKTNSPTFEPMTAAPAAHDYVLPKRPRPAAVVVVPPGPSELGDRGGEAARTLGGHFQLLAETQGMFLAEIRERLEALDGTIAEATKAQMKGAVRELLGVIEWCDTLQADLQADCERATGGQLPIDLGLLLEEVAGRERAAGHEVLVRGSFPLPWWGARAPLSRLLETALQLVAERTNGHGPRCLELSEVGGAPCLRVAGHGDPHEGLEPTTIARFRTLVDQVGASVRPDALGPGGVGMLIQLSPARG